MSNVEVSELDCPLFILAALRGFRLQRMPDVDLVAATIAMQRESRDFPAPRHAWMRYMDAPEDEPVESGYGWRGECQRCDRDAEPVTISVRNT